MPEEAIETTSHLSIANHSHAINLHFLRGKAYFYYQLGLLLWLQRYQPQVLIVETNPRNLSNGLAVSWMHNRGRPVLGWGLGISHKNQLARFVQRRFLKRLDGVIAYSTGAAQQYIDSGIDPARVFVAANAVTPRPSNPPIERPAAFKEGIATLLFVGRLQPRKRVDILLEALADLPTSEQPRLIIVGDGPDRTRLEQLSWGIYPRAVFTGTRHGPELEPYYAAADLFVLPGTGGLAVQQAMAHALPVIVGEADGTQTELVRNENGWVLPDPTPQTLTKTIRQALSDIPRLRSMGKESYRIVSEEVNVEAMVQTFIRAIRSVLDEHN
jgi:glycosyltransferase involved in cell wall biosynthesis